MKKGFHGASDQWNNIIDRLDRTATFDINTFRSSSEFQVFATFDPKRFGLFYYKLLVRTLFASLTPQEKSLFRAIKHREVGQPHAVHVDAEHVCLDYVLAASETGFMAEAASCSAAVVEIGAGFGRTCHTLLSCFPSIERYVIVDLDYTLGISGPYLRKVLSPEQFAKVVFVPVGQLYDADSLFRSLGTTLFVNIDSMAEMSRDVANAYLELINAHGSFFYTNNTLGKYAPADVGESGAKAKDLQDALATGKFPGVINIFDEKAISARVPNFLTEYCPGHIWSARKHAFTICYPHYYQVLYVKGV